jgi:hypothetical protein
LRRRRRHRGQGLRLPLRRGGRWSCRRRVRGWRGLGVGGRRRRRRWRWRNGFGSRGGRLLRRRSATSHQRGQRQGTQSGDQVFHGFEA